MISLAKFKFRNLGAPEDNSSISGDTSEVNRVIFGFFSLSFEDIKLFPLP